MYYPFTLAAFFLVRQTLLGSKTCATQVQNSTGNLILCYTSFLSINLLRFLPYSIPLPPHDIERRNVADV
jgi:hypothetical protein